MLKKFTPLLLVLCMMFVMLPVSAFAADETIASVTVTSKTAGVTATWVDGTDDAGGKVILSGALAAPVVVQSDETAQGEDIAQDGDATQGEGTAQDEGTTQDEDTAQDEENTTQNEGTTQDEEGTAQSDEDTAQEEGTTQGDETTEVTLEFTFSNDSGTTQTVETAVTVTYIAAENESPAYWTVAEEDKAVEVTEGFSVTVEGTLSIVTVVSTAAVTLTTTGLQVDSELPQAATETEGITLTTVWKDNSGTEVTAFSAAGTYTAEITIAANTGYVLDESVTYTLNSEDTTADHNVLTVDVEVAAAEPAPTMYDVTVSETAGGTASANVNTAAMGTEVTVTITPDEGYIVDVVTFNGTVVDVAGNTYTFVMPDEAVTILLTFKKESPVEAPVTATPTVTDDTATSTVAADDITNAIGDATDVGTVTIDATSLASADVKKSVVSLPKAAVEALTDITTTAIQTDVGSIEFPSAVLKTVIEEAETIHFQCENKTAETQKEIFEVGFYNADGNEASVKDQIIKLSLKTSFAAGTEVQVTSGSEDLGATEVDAGGMVSFVITHLSEITIERTESVPVVTFAAENGTDDYTGYVKVTVTGGDDFTDLTGYTASIQINDMVQKKAQMITLQKGTDEGVTFGVNEHTGISVFLYKDGKLVSFKQIDDVVIDLQ